MKSIENVEIKREDSLTIKHIDGDYCVSNFIDKSNGALTFDNLTLKFPRDKYSSYSLFEHSNYLSLSAIPKALLIEFQIVLLHAFVYSHDKLEKAIEKAQSKDYLDELKNKIIIIRKILMSLTNYIDSYEEMLQEYKEI